MIAGEALVADINAFDPAGGAVGLWWLGQHGFVIKSGSGVVYLDAFLSPMPGRLIEPLLAAGQTSHADFVLGTHDHADHIDRESWPAMARVSGANFVVPAVLQEKIGDELGIDRSRLIGIDAGQTIELTHALKLTAVPAAHERLAPDPQTGQFAYLGYILQAGDVTIYHAGDTCWYEGLQSQLRRWQFDAMLVPINGRDAERFSANIVGNLTYQEAADLCGPLEPALVIPTHWDMFGANLGDPAAFLRYMRVKYPDVPALQPAYGRRITLEPEIRRRQHKPAP